MHDPEDASTANEPGIDTSAELVESIKLMEPEAVEIMLAALTQDTLAKKAEGKLLLVGVLSVSLTTSVMASWFIYRTGGGSWIDFAKMTMALFFPAIIPIAAGMTWLKEWDDARQSSRWQNALPTIAQVKDIRMIGQLAVLLDSKDRAIRALAIQVLARLLPRLKAGDAHLLDAEQRTCLYRVLNKNQSNKETEFILSVLNFVGEIGDITALPRIKRLAHAMAKTSNEKKVQEAAQACLSRLQTNAQHASSTLVRPVSVSIDSADTLLRPTEDTPKANIPEPNVTIERARGQNYKAFQ